MQSTKKPFRLKNFIRFEQESIAQFFGLSLIIYALVVVSTLFIAFGQYEKINEEKRIQTDGFTLASLLAAFARSAGVENLPPLRSRSTRKSTKFWAEANTSVSASTP